MNFGKLAVAVLALGVVCGGAAQAQVSVYGVYQAQRLSGLTCKDPQGNCSGTASNAEGAVSSSTDSHVNTTGGWGGVTYDFKTVGPVRLGLDLRAGEGHSNKSATSYSGGENSTSTQNVMLGVKGTFHTPIKILRPYAQVSVGWARSNVAEPFAAHDQSGVYSRYYDNYLAYEGMVGLDIKIFPIMDLRLPELGIGNMNAFGSSNAVTNSVGIKNVGLGIVFHLPAS